MRAVIQPLSVGLRGGDAPTWRAHAGELALHTREEYPGKLEHDLIDNVQIVLDLIVHVVHVRGVFVGGLFAGGYIYIYIYIYIYMYIYIYRERERERESERERALES